MGQTVRMVVVVPRGQTAWLADVEPRLEAVEARQEQAAEPMGLWPQAVAEHLGLASQEEEVSLERWKPLVQEAGAELRVVGSEPWPSSESHWRSLGSPERWIHEAAQHLHQDGSAK